MALFVLPQRPMVCQSSSTSLGVHPPEGRSQIASQVRPKMCAVQQRYWKQRVDRFIRLLAYEHKWNLGAYANRHPTQLLGPPEKVALHQRISVQGTDSRYGSALRTGCRKLQTLLRVFSSCRAIVLVGIHTRLVPTGLCSCEANLSTRDF